ncbi:MAG: NAD(P)H-dependent oxidoreductase [Methylocystaceae bacterium]
MKALIISDKDYQTESFHQLKAQALSYLQSSGFQIEEVSIGPKDLFFCTGCFGCWTEKPGECVITDSIGQINRTVMNSDLVIYLCPLIFGQFSANIKNAIDRSLPNMLPFFVTRSDGSTMHPPRYKSYPQQVMVGYAENLSLDDAQLFIDINKKHRNNVEVFIYQGPDTDITEFLDKIDLKRVEGSL